MNEELLEKILACPRLPSAPAKALQILELVRQPNVNLNQIAQCIKADPALAVKLLRTVNSSFYGAGVPVSRIDQAVVKLGIKTVTTLALSFTLVGAAQGTADCEMNLDDFWRRSLYGAVAARAIATKVSVGSPEEAFLGGLLQDLGVLAMAQCLRGEYASIIQQTGQAALCRVEQEKLGLDHAQVGAALGRRWKLPLVLLNPIRYHEEPDLAPEGIRSLVQVVTLGMHAADALLSEGMASSLNYILRAELWFGLEQSVAAELLGSISDEAKGLLGAFELPGSKTKSITEILAEANERLADLSLQAQHHAADLQRQHDYMAQVARTDALTGVANRRAFDEFASGCFGVLRHCPLSLITFDLDYFKAINDKYGHAMGDEVLVAIGKLLRIMAPPNCLVARIGGEEFSLVLPMTTSQAAVDLAETIRAAIEQEKLEAGGETIQVTASFGVATVEGEGDTAHLHQFLRAADQALYAAKEGGRNQTRVSSMVTV